MYLATGRNGPASNERTAPSGRVAGRRGALAGALEPQFAAVRAGVTAGVLSGSLAKEIWGSGGSNLFGHANEIKHLRQAYPSNRSLG
jgi:hypothetical protein